MLDHQPHGRTRHVIRVNCPSGDGCHSVGQRFAAKEPISVVPLVKGHVKEHVDSHRASAWEFGREIQVWSNAYVVCRPTEKEARDYLHYYVVEKGDWEAPACESG